MSKSRNILKQLCTGLQHIGIPTLKFDQTMSFYDSLSFELVLKTLQPNGLQVAFLKLGNLMLEVYESESVNPVYGAIEHFAVEVTDIEQVYELTGELGYSALEGGIKELPFWEKGVRYFTIKGPNCEKVEYSQKIGRE